MAQAFRSPGSCPPLPVLVPLACRLTSSPHCTPLPKVARWPHIGGGLLTGAVAPTTEAASEHPNLLLLGSAGLKELSAHSSVRAPMAPLPRALPQTTPSLHEQAPPANCLLRNHKAGNSGSTPTTTSLAGVGVGLDRGDGMATASGTAGKQGGLQAGRESGTALCCLEAGGRLTPGQQERARQIANDGPVTSGHHLF